MTAVHERRPRVAHSGFIRWVFISLNLGLSRLTWLHDWLPTRMRESLLIGWNDEMRREAFRSMGKRMYLDVPCELPLPKKLAPLCETEPEYRFESEQLRDFYVKGWAGPFDLLSKGEAASLREIVEEVRTTRTSSVYALGEGHTAATAGPLSVEAVEECVNTRDRHLDCPELWELFHRPEIVERLAQFLGPDLLVWRSQFFNKDPGKPATHWHAASCYVADSLTMPALIPREVNELFQITVWIALDDVDRDNGCLLFIPGSQKQFRPMRVANLDEPRQAWWHGPGVQSDHPYAYPHPIPKEAFEAGHVEAVPMKAGQFLLFSERCIHGAGPNVTRDRRRLGINFRVLRGDVAVNKALDGSDLLYNDFSSTRTRFDLKNWGVGELKGCSRVPNRVSKGPETGIHLKPTGQFDG